MDLSIIAKAIEAVSLAVSDVEKGFAKGDGIVEDVIDSAEMLWQDEAFKKAVIALVAAIKA